MTNPLVGRGLSFPPTIGAQGGFSLTNTRSELDQAIQIILATMPGERVMRPTFGSRLSELQFEPNNGQTATLAQRYVEEALAMWEPRVRVSRVEAYPDRRYPGRLLIDIDYEVKSSSDRRTLVYPFYIIPEEGGTSN